jgi:GAF domain-containing protein
MIDSLTPQTLAVPLVLLLSYTLLAIIVVTRRGLRGREPGIFVGYLVVAAGWFLSAMQRGLVAVFPRVPWETVATYVLIGAGVVFWDAARAFLQKRAVWIGWLPAIILVLPLALLDVGIVVIPPTSLAVGPITFTEALLAPTVSVAVAAIYTAVAVVTALVEYIRRPSPLHRNRIKYWMLSTATLVVGQALVFTHREAVELAAAGVHWLAAALLTYIVVQPQLPDIATGMRRVISYLFAALIPAAITLGMSLGIVYLLNLSQLARLQLTENLFFGSIIAGVVVFLLYRPLSALTRRIVDRLLFGRRYEAEAVVRQYSQAVTQILSLEPLVATAMQIIDDALGVQRGTLLVVEETRESGWWLRVIEGLNVSSDEPQLVLAADTPLADWLVRQGTPLHQYTLDVDSRFDALSGADRAAWRRLNMEVFFPVRRSGTLIGLLALGLRRSGRPYSGAELGLLATLADQTAVALENASLFDRVQRRAEQLALLNEIGRVITSSLDLEPALDLIAGRIEDAFRGASGFIFLLDESRGGLILQSAFGQGVPDTGSFRVRPGQGLVGWVAAEGQPLLAADPASDSRYAPDVEGILAPDAELALCVPVTVRERTIGAILVVSPTRIGLGLTELNLLDSIAAYASIAIENVRQVAAREARLRRQVEALQIRIDEMKRVQHVEEITDTDYFRHLQSQARKLRQERAAIEEEGVFGRLREKLEQRTDTEEESSAGKEQSTRKRSGRRSRKGSKKKSQ